MNIMPKLPQLLQSQDVAFSFWCKDVPENALMVTAFAADEAMSGLTRTEVMLASRDGTIDLNAMLDTPATLSIHHKYLETPRHLSGIVVEAERGDSGHHRTAYKVTLLPVFYRLDIQSDSRIFQGQSVPDIAKTLFAEQGIENVQWELSAEHLIREYCVCYRETLLAFIERIFAEEGIFYFLRHDDRGRHTIILCDRPEILPDCKGQDKLAYNAMASGAVKGVYCSSLAFREKLRTTRFVQRDYTFHAPAANMEHKYKPTMLNGAKQEYELYDYPGRFKEEATGNAFTRHKLEAVRVDASIAHGIANAPHLITGHGVTLTDHPTEALNRRWRLLSIRHEGVQPQVFAEDGIGDLAAGPTPISPSLADAETTGAIFGLTSSTSPGLLAATLGRGLALAAQKAAGADATSATLYACAFTAQSSLLPYRPPQKHKPLIDGPQMAKIVGPPNEEIYCDEHGRVKVQFPWDRYGQSNDNSSCWIRVAQNWGGGMYGHLAVPRIGHEVIVDFLEGDPDQPIITGRTYHATNKTPYKLPDHKTKMVIRSDTHKGTGFNEISFEDQVGEENMFFHAQKDQTVKVLNHATERVDHNKVFSVGGVFLTEVTRSVVENIGQNRTINVGSGSLIRPASTKDTFGIRSAGSSLEETSTARTGAGNFILNAQSLAKFNIGESYYCGVQENYYFHVGKDAFHTVSGSLSTSISGNHSEVVGKMLTIDAHGKLHLRSGASEIVLNPNGKSN